ncbi:MAG: TetR/AcrR family transcriptional regulator [Ruminococcaceae bacterium]|nr:TetR/AcrR family transcriptional regulator [Oscillospiraceae bacterium]
MKRSEITKQKILAAAEKAFAEKGLYGARVDDIAEQSGANKRMIYAYFGSKEKLYVAVLERVYSRIAESEKELLNKETDCTEAIRRIIRHSFDFLYEDPSFVKMVMWENLNQGQFLKESEAPRAKGISVELLRKVLRQGKEQGIFRENVDIEELIVSINMFCFSYFSNIYTMGQIMQTEFSGRAELDKRCEHITDIILEYIVKEREQ